jgi:hypothetical protein
LGACGVSAVAEATGAFGLSAAQPGLCDAVRSVSTLRYVYVFRGTLGLI